MPPFKGALPGLLGPVRPQQSGSFFGTGLATGTMSQVGPSVWQDLVNFDMFSGASKVICKSFRVGLSLQSSCTHCIERCQGRCGKKSLDP